MRKIRGTTYVGKAHSGSSLPYVGRGPFRNWTRPPQWRLDAGGLSPDAKSSMGSRLIATFVLLAFLCPADMVIKVVGASGHAAGLFGLTLLAFWVVSSLLGFHDPLHTRHPTRAVVGLMIVSSLLSYAAMPFYNPTEVQSLSALRWMLQWLCIAGIVVVTAEFIRAKRDLIRVVRVLVWGAAVSGVVAAVQFATGWDPAGLLRSVMLGFSLNAEIVLDTRGTLTRAIGTAGHPIELGVIAGMILPLAFWLLIYDEERSRLSRLLAIAGVGLAIPVSVTRSAVLATAIGLGVLVVLLPARHRMWILGFAPLAAVAVFISTPGYLRTISSFIIAGSTDPSVMNRTNNYPIVERLVTEAPWLGRGGGTYIQRDLTKVLDNEYLMAAIELGLIGLVCMVLYFLVPVLTALNARRMEDWTMRSLCAALAGGTLAAAVCGLTFDSLSFAQFACVHAVFVGLCGSCWLYSTADQPADDGAVALVGETAKPAAFPG
ncbi:O-antigen ligase family protein [Catellatospora sichuanensis]|uniref:O-antigen ligase family protein n=1 Tax=Catellatospora sichuanensis TaxID=1969805 RepID=UPI001642FB9F|nr:O-antigen ligase family protein [Catellatospora sichuanensis]